MLKNHHTKVGNKVPVKVDLFVRAAGWLLSGLSNRRV